ncbi:MAG: polysaccharide deacetylase family protein [Bacteroidales bacterium]|jgi:hypothetical protein|nr:polysaccharide deacetylase family protein [Bacteroidales bacterium]
MILIYCNKVTERLKYISQHIFDRILGIESRICTDVTVFRTSTEYKINYSNMEMDDIVSIVPHNLLFEDNITPQKVDISLYKDMPVCFQTKQFNELPFDVFAACFFFISRYEEYLPHHKDRHQRYDEKESVAYQYHFLHLAVVDCWTGKLAAVLKSKYADIVFSNRKYTFIPTYDIDSAYAYLHKGFLWNVAGGILSFLRGDFKEVKTRIEVLAGRKQDSYYTFDYLFALHQRHKLRPCYFFLLARRWSDYDKNINPANKHFQNLMRQLDAHSDTGLHASYYVKDDPKKINSEIASLQTVLQKPITKNRHHYLRFSLPESYRLLISKGIKEDYSMGYVQTPGFRAGTCHPFLFFDLQNNKTTDLLVYPLIFMENAFYGIQDPQEIVRYLLPYIDEVKRHNGTFVTLFHNQSFKTGTEGDKWKTVYETLLSYLKVSGEG